ncbi:MAG: two-component system response regulator [candidate division NC10 bacterium RIFCSPLOWO2_12_FULL_66_18]|nr:MAG: two-component system response regulator [candidate division NC10 bacterium RIFCSPLOWO2_12_FULL_66_18]
MKTILVVDDEEAIRLLYREELSEAGYQVQVAANGSEALRMAQQSRPDLMTIDIKMPGMDGIELLRKVREIYRDLPIIICTAYGDFKRDFGTWASDAYLTKSADLAELKDKIRELLGRPSHGEKTSRAG